MDMRAADSDNRAVLDELRLRLGDLPVTGRLGQRECEVIYAQGHTLFQRGLYEQAAEIFSLLNLYRPLEPRYLYAHAMCHKLLCRFDMAASLFFTVLTLDHKDPVPAKHLAQCLFALQHDELAFEALEMLLRRAGDETEHAQLRAQAFEWLAVKGKKNE